MNKLEAFIADNNYPDSEILNRTKEQYVQGFIGFKFASILLKEYYSPSKETVDEIYWDTFNEE